MSVFSAAPRHTVDLTDLTAAVRTKSILFLFGGGVYAAIELLYRQRTYLSMFFAGGMSLLLINRWCNRPGTCRQPLVLRCCKGAAAITTVEFLVGIVFNRNHTVWDYSHLPLNVFGQICLPFSLIWSVLSIPAMKLSALITRALSFTARP